MYVTLTRMVSTDCRSDHTESLGGRAGITGSAFGADARSFFILAAFAI